MKFISSETFYFYPVDDVTGNPVIRNNNKYPIEIEGTSKFFETVYPLVQLGLAVIDLYSVSTSFAYGSQLPKIPKKIRNEFGQIVKPNSFLSKNGGLSRKELIEFYEQNDEDEYFAGLEQFVEDGDVIWTTITNDEERKRLWEEKKNDAREKSGEGNFGMPQDPKTDYEESGDDEETETKPCFPLFWMRCEIKQPPPPFHGQP